MTYRGIGTVVAVLTFIVTWIVCIAHYGLLAGFWLGWLPAVIIGGVVGLLWPIPVGLGVWLLFHFGL